MSSSSDDGAAAAAAAADLLPRWGMRAPRATRRLPDDEAIDERTVASMCKNLLIGGMYTEERALEIMYAIDCCIGDDDLVVAQYGHFRRCICSTPAPIDWVSTAVEGSVSDQTIAVVAACAPVTEYAFECACRNDWWRTTLPLLLAAVVQRRRLGEAFARDPHGEVVLQYSVLHPEQLAVLPQQFLDAGLQLKLRLRAWTATAVNLAFVADSGTTLAAAQSVLEQQLLPEIAENSDFDWRPSVDATKPYSLKAEYRRIRGVTDRAPTVDVPAFAAWFSRTLLPRKIALQA